MRMDTQLITKSEVLNREALVKIYEAYNLKLYRYAYRLLGDRDTAEECVAETFSRFLGSLKGNPAGPDNVQAYLFRISHNWITDYYRRQPPPMEPLLENIEDRKNGNGAAELSNRMEQERVRKALLRLPDDQRQVIVLRFLADQSHGEVAAALGKSPDATRALQYRALNSLRRMLLKPEAV